MVFIVIIIYGGLVLYIIIIFTSFTFVSGIKSEGLKYVYVQFVLGSLHSS